MSFPDFDLAAPRERGILAITLGTTFSVISRHWDASDKYTSCFPMAEKDDVRDRNPPHANLIPKRLDSRLLAVPFRLHGHTDNRSIIHALSHADINRIPHLTVVTGDARVALLAEAGGTGMDGADEAG